MPCTALLFIYLFGLLCVVILSVLFCICLNLLLSLGTACFGQDSLEKTILYFLGWINIDTSFKSPKQLYLHALWWTNYVTNILFTWIFCIFSSSVPLLVRIFSRTQSHLFNRSCTLTTQHPCRDAEIERISEQAFELFTSSAWMRACCIWLEMCPLSWHPWEEKKTTSVPKCLFMRNHVRCFADVLPCEHKLTRWVVEKVSEVTQNTCV